MNVGPALANGAGPRARRRHGCGQGEQAGNGSSIPPHSPDRAGEAKKCGHLRINPAEIAKAPRLEEEEIEPYTAEEVQRLLLEAANAPNSTRWVLALALGLRQGEALGLRWTDVDLEAGSSARARTGYARSTRRMRERRMRQQVRLLQAGSRPGAKPNPRSPARAGEGWVDKGNVFTKADGEPLISNTDYHHWKKLLRDVGVGRAAA